MSRALAVCHGEFGRATVYELDRPLVTHAHREGHLVHQFGGPGASVTVRGKPVACRSDRIVTINPWEPHAFAPANLLQPGLVFVMYIRPQWLQRVLKDEFGSSILFQRPDCTITPALGRLLRTVLRMLDAPPQDGSLDKLLAEICVMCAQEGMAAAGDAPQPVAVNWNALDHRVRRSVAALSDPAAAFLPMERLALSCGLSRAHFFKLFSDQTGVTPSVFANTIRIEESLRRIAAPNASIAGIGDGLGFSCQSAFTRFFVAHIGMAPTAYRAAIRILGDAHAA
jgi:AraC-like DNA-binding protein